MTESTRSTERVDALLAEVGASFALKKLVVAVRAYLRVMSDAQRLTTLRALHAELFCRSCGSKHLPCHCEADK